MLNIQHPKLVYPASALLLALAFPAGAAEAPVNVEIVGHVEKPLPLEPSADRIAGLDLPEGFKIQKFAGELKNVRMIAVADDGSVYVTRRKQGDCLLLRDSDGDGRADQQQVVASKPDMHGVAIHDGQLYLTTIKEIYRADIQPDATLGELERIIDDLPDGGQHANRSIAFGPDNMLYISVGSTCNACDETSEESATILRARADGSERSVLVSGLRNTIGFDWHPQTGELYGADHGIDWLGDDEQREEINHLQDGKQYGWPYVYADSQYNPQDTPTETTMEEWAAMSTEPVLFYTPHSAPMQMAFYTGDQFPAEYRNDAFIAMRGSWNRRPPSGYEVVRIHFENGKPVAIEPFISGLLVQQADGSYGRLGRLMGLAVTPDGALLVGDDSNGIIYRVSYEKSG
jgi:glucose/arabinose dehydrogenase